MPRNALRLCLLVVAALPLFAVARGEKVKVACVGNSITYGFTLEDPATQSYPAQLQKLLGDGYEVGNFGKSGATLLRKGHRPYNEQEEFGRALDFAGDIVVIHLGVNDTDPRDWPNYGDEFIGDYLKLIDTLRSRNPDCRVLVARLTPIGQSHYRFESGTRDWRDRLQEAIETVARVAGAELIDFEEPLYAYPQLLPDAIHPNLEGSGRLARTVYSAITGDYGGLQVSPLLTDHMVLQRERSIEISGRANKDALVSIVLAGCKQTVRTPGNGRWSVSLPAMKAGGPYELSISDGSTSLAFHDVMIGEVWLCSGQSNMEFMLRQAETAARDVPQARNEQIRVFDMKARWRTDPVEWGSGALDSVNHLLYFGDAKWKVLTPETAADFSAVAYYFGQMLQDSLGVPVGLICNAVGGSPTEAWIDRSTLEHEFPKILSNWTENDFIQDWVRGRAKQNMAKASIAGQRHPYEPCYLYESGIKQLTDFAVRGVIWYQGESNAHNQEAHSRLFKLLVASWRKAWKNPEMPFYYVQLSSIDRPSWPAFRDSQRKLLYELDHVGMAVSSDVGDSLDVHPTRKQPVGQRLARLALADTYGCQVTPLGPLFREAVFAGDTVYVSFDYAEGLCARDGREIRGFEVATDEGLYQTAVAEVAGNCLKVYSDSPCGGNNQYGLRYVRYAWQPFTRANLVNSEGLPASTFKVAKEKGLSVTAELTEGFPSKNKGYRQGVSALYSGVLPDGRLLIAGGANFPKIPAADGGAKAYYSDVYAAEVVPGEPFNWKKLGSLPVASAYGATVKVADGLVCIGGTTERGSLSAVYKLMLRDSRFTIENMPSLPVTIDNTSACLIDSTLYVLGGNVDGSPSCRAFSIDLQDLAGGWQELPSFPGSPRTQPVVAAAVTREGEKALFMWGGFAAAGSDRAASLETAGYAYVPSRGEWIALPAPTDERGETISLGGGCAISLCDTLIVAVGGVNKDIFLKALTSPEPDYMRHEPEWYKFNTCLLVYNSRTACWDVALRNPLFARAGASLVSMGYDLYLINGELKPGIRTPQITRITFSE